MMAKKGIKTLSILIPTYNERCTELVSDLRQQAFEAGLDFEILVSDDGSTNAEAKAQNHAINAWPCCRYIEQPQNLGRAANRNFLAREAHHEWLLFIDSHMSVINQSFIANYIQTDEHQIVNGGVRISGDADTFRGNLRYRYEKAAESEHTLEQRRRNPYQDFHTANFLIHRDLMLAHPFDERFRRYGYEDVLFGKTQKKARIPIVHIDNPIGFCTFESNEAFMAKTEEGLRTLYTFRQELRGYSRILTFVDGIHIPAVLWFIHLWHRALGRMERKNLCSNHPSLRLFTLYKLGYFLSLP